MGSFGDTEMGQFVLCSLHIHEICGWDSDRYLT